MESVKVPDAEGEEVSQIGLPLPEIVKLGALDTEFFAKSFFPIAFRHESPPFAREMWEPLEDASARMVNIICFRGAGKTTRLRVFAAKRISYGLSRTILYIGASERDAIRSVVWIRNQIERNSKWARAFGLRRGNKWDETQIEIIHDTLSKPGEPPIVIHVLAAGMTGSLRGINFDDYRPDLIVVDDPQTDETAATEEQRNKIADLIFGAVKNSLASEVDEPNAKIAMCITPQHKEDISQLALRDPQWTSVVFPCWTRETLDLRVDKQESSWPTLFPTAKLRADKLGAIERNRLSVFTREMECRLTSQESAQFRPAWLNIRKEAAPRGCFAVLAIDPVPPPSPAQQARGLAGKDFETHYVWGRYNGEYHLLDWDRSRGHDPSWTIATAFRLARQHRVVRIIFDAVAYQRSIKWMLEQAMQRFRNYYAVVPIADGMKKFARITGTVGGLAQQRKLWVPPNATNFIQQFEEYGPTYSGHDDDLDASALALQDLSKPFLEEGADPYMLNDDDVEQIDFQRVCP